MKKIRILLSIITLVILATTTMLSLSADAYDWTYYDIQNEAYAKIIDRYNGKFIHQDEVKEMLINHLGEWSGKLVNVYSIDENNGTIEYDENGNPTFAYSAVSREYENSDGGRHFVEGAIYWTMFEYRGEEAEGEIDFYNKYVDDVNAYLKENNYKAKFVEMTENDRSYYVISYDKDITIDDVVLTGIALAEKYELYPEIFALAFAKPDIYYDETPAGDVDKDNEVTVRDCSFIAMKIASSEADSLPLSADFNGDEKVNVRDAAAIANHLATK